MYTFSMYHSRFYLMHHKILMIMEFRFAKVQIKGIWISEGLLYHPLYIKVISYKRLKIWGESLSHD